jgi:sigma-E factor negative regulatory protein RseC
MIEEAAIVVKTEGDRAIVATQRTTSCGGCSAKNSCGTPVLAKVMGNRLTKVEVENPIKAELGDHVIIGLQETALLRVSLLFYIFPLILLFTGSVSGQWLAEQFSLQSTEPMSIACGLLGLFAGLFMVRKITKQSQHNKQYQAVILRHQGQTKIVHLS